MPGFLTAKTLAPWEHGFGMRGASLPPNLATVKQIHSNLVLVAGQAGLCGDGDALITNQPGVAVSIRTADCYPILLADARNGAIAAVHAGWRGTAAKILMETLQRMKKEYGTEPADVSAAIGPGIRVCCFEVGEEVACQFGYTERTHLDLAWENRKQLEEAGVEKIEALGICTFCDAERFFSYRRERESAGRLTSFIRLPES
jgi:polyphenol oxidase